MLLSYIRITIRKILKSKSLSVISISGITAGLTLSILTMYYVLNEYSFENFHLKKDDIYRITVDWGMEGSRMQFAGSMPALGPAFKEALPEVLNAVRIRKEWNANVTDGEENLYKADNFFFADPEIFDIFTVKLKDGIPDEMLKEPYSVVISESAAEKIFNDKNVVGKNIEYNDEILKITGVFEDIPLNTHLKFDYIVSFSTLYAMGKIPEMEWNSWGDDLTYLLLAGGCDCSALEGQMAKMMKTNLGEYLAERIKLSLQPLDQVHWNNELRGDVGPKGSLQYIYLFIIAASVILLIACFNYINISLSGYLDRIKEIGIRKVIGAKRSQIAFQYLLETFIIILTSFFFSLILADFLTDPFFNFLRAVKVLPGGVSSELLTLIAAVIFMTIVFAGIYPTLYISRFSVVDIINGKYSAGKGKLTIRKLFVVIQYAVSVTLIILVLLISRQINYMKNSDLGFHKEKRILLHFPYNDEIIQKKYHLFRNELNKHPSVLNVSSAYSLPGLNSMMNISVYEEGGDENSKTLQALPADIGIIPTLGLELAEGRNFDEQIISDFQESIILNEKAVKTLELENAIGSRLIIPGGDKPRTVIGIVKDFHLQSMRRNINPLVIYPDPSMMLTIIVEYSSDNPSEALAAIKSVWTGIIPEKEYSFSFLEDKYDLLYLKEERTVQLLTGFSVIAIIISSLGLFGISSLLVSGRKKETGVRKILGASPRNLFLIYMKDFMAMVLISNIIAWPAAGYIIDLWLTGFAYKTDVAWWIFVISAISCFSIAILTTFGKVSELVKMNPVDTLRNE